MRPPDNSGGAPAQERRPAPAASPRRDAAPSIAPGAHRAGLLALSAERDLWLRRLLAAERAAYRRGAEHGWKQGYEQACADQQAAWHAVAWRVARGDPRSHAQLEAERWKVHGEPRTRETFGRPHPADRRPRTEAAP